MSKLFLDFVCCERSDTFENWQSENPILHKGEKGVVIDAKNENWLKIGDGITPWNDLPYRKGPAGAKGDKGDKGDTGAQGIQGPQGERGLQGLQGVKGDSGEPFYISKIYTSVNEMNADYNNPELRIGNFVLISTGNVADEDNAKLFVKGNNAYEYITDLSGAQGIQGPKGDKGEQGNQGEQGIQGIQGVQGEKGDTGERGERGYSGLMPLVNVSYSSEITVSANTETVIGQLTGSLTITLGGHIAGYSNEWVFIVNQGETAYEVNLPEIEWQLGVAPVFSANTVTEVRLYYSGNILKGVWA